MPTQDTPPNHSNRFSGGPASFGPPSRRVAVAVGGTAGHTHAALAVAEAYRDEWQAQVCLVGPKEAVEFGTVAQSGFDFEVTAAGPFARQAPLGRLVGLMSTAVGYRQSARILERRSSEVAVGCGGYASVPTLLAARSLGIPVVLHESNAAAGLANRLLDTIAARVLLGYPEAASCFRTETRVTGNPVLARRRQQAALRTGGAPSEPPLMLVTGGSEGSPFLNRRVPEVLGSLRGSGTDLRVVHQTGREDPNPTRELYRGLGISAEVRRYFDPMETYLALADVAISSAGAITLAELALFGIPALVVPLSQVAWAHQHANAALHARQTGAAWLTEEAWSTEKAVAAVAALLHAAEARGGSTTRSPSDVLSSSASRIVEECEATIDCRAGRVGPNADATTRHRPRAMVLALGDLGRSPRMVQHAVALDRNGWDVSLIGLAGRQLPDCVESSGIRCVRLPAHHRDPSSPWSLAHAGLRMGRLAVSTLRALWQSPPPELILAQTPPVLPTVMVAAAMARIRRASLWLDWHNLSYRMLAARSTRRSAVAALAAHEHFVARWADGHLCVSEAMRRFLIDRWRLQPVHLFRDAPACGIRSRDAGERGALREDLVARQRPAREFLADASARPTAWVVTASSWAEEDAWQLLAPALGDYDRAAAVDASLPRILLSVTGDGPHRREIEVRLRRQRLTHVHCVVGWLSWRDYAAQLAAADLGICLHRSTSGLDLPMKAWDMIGAALPFVAFDYGPTLDELDSTNAISHRFSSALELSCALQAELRAFPDAACRGRRRRLRHSPQPPGFTEAWGREVNPLLARSCPAGRPEVRGNSRCLRSSKTVAGLSSAHRGRGFSVIIPTLWVSEHLQPLLAGLVASPHVSEIVLIDNNRRFFEHYQSKDEKICLLQPERNLYVNPSWNLGVAKAREDLICLCNDDISFDMSVFAKMSRFDGWDQTGLIGVHRWCYLCRSRLLPFCLWPTQERAFGFGCLLFMNKVNYVPIPEELKVWCGDDFLCRVQRHPNYAIMGLRIKTPMSATANLPEFQQIRERDRDTFAERTLAHWPCCR